MMTIGQVAKNAGVNVQTIRFYERKGLVLPDNRKASGYRTYTQEAVKRIRFIKHAQEIGFALREIEELLALRVDPGMTCANVKEKAEEKSTEVKRKIIKLNEMEQALDMLIAQCGGLGPVSECPIIEALDQISSITSD